MKTISISRTILTTLLAVGVLVTAASFGLADVQEVKCVNCSGSGTRRETCNICKGSGLNSTGKSKCVTCDGKRFASCHYCAGTGKRKIIKN